MAGCSFRKKTIPSDEPDNGRASWAYQTGLKENSYPTGSLQVLNVLDTARLERVSEYAERAYTTADSAVS